MAGLPHFAASKRWQTGDNSSSSSVQFQRITGIDSDSAGSIYVLDLGSGVRVFSPSGVLVNEFAPKGLGPAELDNPRSIAVGKDTVFVLDKQLKLFRTNGAYIDQVTSDSGEFMRAVRIAYTRSGLAVQRRRSTRRSAQPGGEVHDTLDVYFKNVADYSESSSATHSYGMVTYPVGSLSISGPTPLLNRVSATVAESGAVYSPDQEHFIIEVRSAAGDVLERVVGQVARVATSNADLDDLVRSITSENNSDEARYQQYRQEFAKVPRAEYRPALGELLVSRTGYVLVQRTDLSTKPYNRNDSASIGVWLLIAPDWTPLGYISLPGRFRPRVIDGCAIIGYETDDFNVQSLTRYDFAAPTTERCMVE